MDPEIKNPTFLFIFHMSLFCTLEGMGLKEIAISLGHWQQFCCMTLALHGLKRCGGRGRRQLWAHDRSLFKPGIFDHNLLGSFNSREFRGKMRMDVFNFEYLCNNLAPELQRRDMNMHLAILIQVKVDVGITRLASGTSMQCIADLYRIGLSSSLQVVSEFCLAIKKFAKKIY